MYDISLGFQPEPNNKPSTNITLIPVMEVFFVMVPEVHLPAVATVVMSWS